MTVPWHVPPPLGTEAYGAFRRRAIFECCKWDPQVEDTATLAPFPVVLDQEAWREIAGYAEMLAEETLRAEAELLERPELQTRLGLPARCRAALRRCRPPARGVARLIRFDFHLTRNGWRISEANTDVPGGLNEASGISELMAGHYHHVASVGDVAGAYARALLQHATDGHVALVHATAYTDDHQVMAYLARHLGALGGKVTLVSPAQVRWTDRGAWAASTDERVDVIGRFYPAEWLPELPNDCQWDRFFGGSTTPMSNPATALLTQSKRLPLVWDRLRTSMPTWRALLPETRHPRDIPWRERDSWVLKPALGRVGHGIGIRGVTPAKDWRRIARAAWLFPRWWVAQRRFEPTPLVTHERAEFPCIGVYTIDGRAVGAYGRIARTPLIDWRARDVSILVDTRSTAAVRWSA